MLWPFRIVRYLIIRFDDILAARELSISGVNMIIFSIHVV